MLLLLFSLLLAAASVMALPQDPHLIPVIATLTLPNGSLTTSTWTHTPIVVDGAGPLPSNWKYFFLTETTTATVTDPTIAALAASTVYAPPVTTTLTKPGVPIPMPVQYVYITVTSPGTRTVTEERTVERSVTVTETASGTAGCEPPPPGEEVEETVIVTESRTSTTTVLTYIQPTVTATSTPTEEEETVIVTESQTSTTTVLTYIQPTVTSTSSNSSDSPSSKSTVTVYTSTCPSCAPGSTSSTAIPPPTTTDSSTSTTSTLPTTSAPDSEPTSDVLFTLPTAVPSAPDFADSLNLASIPHPANHMTTTNHPFGPIPHPCYAETTGLAMYCSPYDIEVHSIYYEDCLTPTVVCRCNTSPLTLPHLTTQLSLLPPPLRSRFPLVTSYPAPKCGSALTSLTRSTAHLLLFGPCDSPGQYFRQAGVMLDYAAAPAGEVVYSNGDEWHDIMGADGCAADAVGKRSWNEAYASVVVLAAVSANVEGVDWERFNASTGCLKGQLEKVRGQWVENDGELKAVAGRKCTKIERSWEWVCVGPYGTEAGFCEDVEGGGVKNVDGDDGGPRGVEDGEEVGWERREEERRRREEAVRESGAVVVGVGGRREVLGGRHWLPRANGR